MPLDLGLDHAGPGAQLLGRALLAGQRRDDLLRAGGLAGLLGGVRADQVDHADGAHHRAVTRDVARPHHLAAVTRLQRGLKVRAVHRGRAGLGGAGRRPDVRLAVQRELRRVEPRDGQRLGISGPGPDVLPLAQGLVEAGGPGRVRGQPQCRRHRRVDPWLVQVLVPGEPGPGREHGGRGEPRDAGPRAAPGPPAAPPSRRGDLGGSGSRGRRAEGAGVVRRVTVRAVLDGERAGRRVPGAGRACRGFGRVAGRRETLAWRTSQVAGGRETLARRTSGVATVQDRGAPGARADQAIGTGAGPEDPPRAGRGVQDPLRARPGGAVRVRRAVRRRPGRLTSRVRGRSGASRAPMVHSVERSVLFSSGRVDAELSRLSLAA